MKIDFNSIPSGFTRNSRGEKLIVGLTLLGLHFETRESFVAYIGTTIVYCRFKDLNSVLNLLREKKENNRLKRR
jgi:hypothetical protein